MNATMKINAIAPWFGGKRTLAPRIVEVLGDHVSYFEPFCGSMAVLFAKPRSSHETVNDLHGDLINLAYVLQDPDGAPDLYDRTMRALVCEPLLEEAERQLAKPFDSSAVNLLSDMVERAFWYFLASWVVRNGVAGTARMNYQIAVRWTAGGGSPSVRFRSAVESIPAWHDRLRNVVILNRDAFKILDSIPDVAGTAIYLDPPYARETRGCKDPQGAGRYLHEFQHGGGGDLFEAGAADDHERLARAVRRFQNARVVVSYYDCERIRRLYEGWTFIDCKANKQLANSNRPEGRGKGRIAAPEILIVNGA